MIGNGNFEGVIKKQVTDFTIDCILSKDEANEKRSSASLNQPVTLNKVLNNNPWIPISPLAHFFTPSAIHKKFPLPNLLTYYPSPNFLQNLIKASVEQNHLYSSNASLNLIQKSNLSYHPSDEGHFNKSLSPLKSNSVHEKLSCDTQIVEIEQQNHLTSNSPASSTLSDVENKCPTCFKFFETNELLEVSE